MSNKKRSRKKSYSIVFYKEVALAIMAVMSVMLVGLELLLRPGASTVSGIYRFEMLVVSVFLADFLYAMYRAVDRWQYVRTNWYLLLACIPIFESWADILRGLRLLELVRLVRAGEHVEYVIRASRKKSGA